MGALHYMIRPIEPTIRTYLLFFNHRLLKSIFKRDLLERICSYDFKSFLIKERYALEYASYEKLLFPQRDISDLSRFR